MGMAEVGRQDRQATLNIGALPVPLHEGLDRQAVPEVVQAGPSAVGLPAHARFAGQLVERPTRSAIRQAVTVLGKEEGIGRPQWTEAIPWTGVPAPCVIS